METYVTQLRSDLHAATLARWRRNTPHFYQAGLRDAMHQPPEGYVEKPAPEEMPGHFEASIGEMEDWLHGKPAITMFDHFGFTPDQFPPAEQLTEEQAQALADALVRLWVAYNFLPTMPKKTPARVFYPAMLARIYGYIMTPDSTPTATKYSRVHFVKFAPPDRCQGDHIVLIGGATVNIDRWDYYFLCDLQKMETDTSGGDALLDYLYWIKYLKTGR